LGLAGGAALMLPLERLARTRLLAENRLAESALPAPFQVPLTTPPVLSPARANAPTDLYEIRQRAAQVEILPGLRTTIFGYNGVTPGPTIKVRRGRQTVVRQINELPATHPTLGYPVATSTHLHGNASAPQYDGWANDLTPPGFYKDYVYQNGQDARTLLQRPCLASHGRERL
jgi:spore coat protein A